MMSSSPFNASRRSQVVIRTWNGHGPPTEVNVAIVGALGVGKSALTVKYITRRFISEYDPDLEDTYSKTEIVDQKEVVIRLMDTRDKPGKDPERYLKWADAFLVVYSITNRPSFEIAHSYLEGIAQHQRLASSQESPTILVGNKVDMERYRQVSKAEGSALAAHYDCAFFEATAAEEYDSVERVFHEMIREVMREHERCMPLRPLFISEDKAVVSGSRNSSRLLTTTRKDPPPPPPLTGNQGLQEKNGSRFKFFNKGKGFKAIFQSV